MADQVAQRAFAAVEMTPEARDGVDEGGEAEIARVEPLERLGAEPLGRGLAPDGGAFGLGEDRLGVRVFGVWELVVCYRWDSEQLV